MKQQALRSNQVALEQTVRCTCPKWVVSHPAHVTYCRCPLCTCALQRQELSTLEGSTEELSAQASSLQSELKSELMSQLDSSEQGEGTLQNMRINHIGVAQHSCLIQQCLMSKALFLIIHSSNARAANHRDEEGMH